MLDSQNRDNFEASHVYCRRCYELVFIIEDLESAFIEVKDVGDLLPISKV